MLLERTRLFFPANLLVWVPLTTMVKEVQKLLILLIYEFVLIFAFLAAFQPRFQLFFVLFRLGFRI